MRKTSQDGTDSTSLTNGLDNDFKRPGTSSNKIKKTSIKRKVPNYSNDSDDAIIEPLLQTEKEHSVVANESAKYSLNKSKTECLLEKDTKPLENSTPVSSPNTVTNNIIPENQPSPASISETTPIYNHLNVNVLSELDLKKLDFPIGKSIILEIDGCKAVCHGPSPLIFTTAKIHADTKTEVMELFKATPTPIFSPNEGDVVKTGILEDDQRHSVLHPNKQDFSKNVGHKSDVNIGPSNLSEVLTNKTLSNSTQIKNLETTKKEIVAQDPFENAIKNAKLLSKDQKVSMKTSNDNSVDPISPISKVTSDDTVLTKQIIANSTCKANGGFVSESSKQLIGTVTKSNTSDRNTNKSKGLSHNDKIDLNQTLQSCASVSKQINKSNINTPQKTKIDNTKGISTASKKLQRQKNASIEETKEINYKGLNNVTTVKNSAILDKPVSTPIDIKSDSATLHKSSTPVTTTPVVTSGIPSKTLNSTSINPSICKSSVTTGTSAPINDKPSTEIVKTKPGPSKIPEPSAQLSKSAVKTPANTTAVATTVTSSKTSTTSTAKSTKVTDDTSAAKQEIKSISVLPSNITKTEQATTSSAASALPLYIVSTSKTKIGSSSSPSTSMVTNKTLEQKPITEIVNTDAKSGKLLMSTSSSQSKQSSAKPKITKLDIVKKDNRA